MYRLFCSHCGSCLFAKIGNGDITIVHPGNVKEDVDDWGECLCIPSVHADDVEVPRKETYVHGRWKWVKEIMVQPNVKAKL